VLRIVGGEERGRLIKAPPSRTTRPTADRVREAVFSILYSRQANLALCLDLYAGSGAFGLEALSRGAGQAHFVESDRAACAVIAANIETLGYEERAVLHCLSVAGLSRQAPTGDFTLLFADPPYDLEAQEDELRGVLAAISLSPDAILVYEHSRRRTPPQAYGRLAQVLTRRYGDSCVTLYQEA
jgi:16S rRNA (guanine966-N2)-methyltransferase